MSETIQDQTVYECKTLGQKLGYDTGHPLLHNPNTWSLSQLQDFQSSDACLNYVFGLVSLMLFGLV